MQSVAKDPRPWVSMKLWCLFSKSGYFTRLGYGTSVVACSSRRRDTQRDIRPGKNMADFYTGITKFIFNHYLRIFFTVCAIGLQGAHT
ncbi:hypothetical protein AYI70_g12345 [Smittium culicis]|uniref:Uncharacterized protein n=1 Tax=Smittium culicis TaxID=133412 RepID=A0A1R1WXV7_9FUNG|nr:hypothetical protein AYI70_g12345 [Smittium culicis]